jgi:hypothetical protein
MARLYADEDFHYAVVEQLRQLGHDALTVHEAGQGNQGIPDPDVLAFAIGVGRAVLTYNRWDYVKLHSRVQPHSGIIVCSRDRDLLALAVRIHQAIANLASLDSLLIRVNRPP